MTNKIKGTVKWFNESKGFGFIQANGEDYFVHFSAIQTQGFRTLNEGATVLFNFIKDKRGLQATDVEIV